jgi:hypothetical protein
MLPPDTLEPVRVLRAIGLTAAGSFLGFVAAALLAKRALPSQGDETSDEVALTAIFGGVELKSRARAFRGGSMLAWFGGIAVDLREADLAPDARLSVSTLLGGIAIRVPPGWKVESRATAVAGGVDIDAPQPGEEDAPVLVLDGFAFLGGIAVKAGAADDAEPAA